MARGATMVSSVIGEEDDENDQEGDESADGPDADVRSKLSTSGALMSERLDRAPSIASIPGGPLKHDDLLKRLFDTSRAYRDYKRLGFEFVPPLSDYITHSPNCTKSSTENLRLSIGNSRYLLCRRLTYTPHTNNHRKTHVRVYEYVVTRKYIPHTYSYLTFVYDLRDLYRYYHEIIIQVVERVTNYNKAKFPLCKMYWGSAAHGKLCNFVMIISQ